MDNIYNNIFNYIGTIFMLHRVDDFNTKKLFSNENMKVSPSILESKILELVKKNYSFISIDELYYNLINNIKNNKCIVFTLDDGYLDNYTNALPIFKQYNIPFTIYVTNSFPDQKFTMWWYALEDIILNSNSYINYRSKKFKCDTLQNKEASFLQIRNSLVTSRFPNLEFLRNFESYINTINIDDYNRLAMNWNILKNISKEKLVTIGSHTISHPSLNYLNPDDLIFEVMESRKLLEKKLDIKIDHFAYPFGSKIEVSDKVIKQFNKFNFKTCVTTRSNNIYSKHSTKLTGLPRVMLTNDFNINSLSNFNFLRYFIN